MALPLLSDVLVCFALPEEAAGFSPRAGRPPSLTPLLTGIGPANAYRALSAHLAHSRPSLIVSSGFAGGLNPRLRQGQIVVETRPDTLPQEFEQRIDLASHVRGRFLSVDRILTSPAEKADARAEFGADAVEMESSSLAKAAAERGCPFLVMRVISDAADESLPLDFNKTCDANYNLSAFRLARELLRRPGQIPRLVRLQRELRSCASLLGTALIDLLGEPGPSGSARPLSTSL